MHQVAEELISVVERASESLRSVNETEASRSYRAGGWTRKELIGHLIDSASNNHQRFVRAQGVSFLEFPKYEQQEWVARQNYREASWADLVELWRLYNRHLANVIQAVPAEKLEIGIRIGPSDPVTLGFVIKDYLRHLKHHLNQIGL